MNNFIEIFFLVIVIIVCLFVILKLLRKKEDFKRSLKLTFLSITLPKKDSDLDERHETAKDFKEMISIMEQLYSSLKSIYSGKLLKKIL